jgi:hypothetical protein
MNLVLIASRALPWASADLARATCRGGWALALVLWLPACSLGDGDDWPPGTSAVDVSPNDAEPSEGGADAERPDGLTTDDGAAGADTASDGGDGQSEPIDAGEGGDAPPIELDGEDGEVDASEGCPELPVCGDHQRVVGCECVSMMDRRCLTDADCRPDETCEAFDGLSVNVCWWTPPPVAVCPGGAGCPTGGDGQLYAGAASMVVTPDGFETAWPAGLDPDNTINFGPELDPTRWRDCGYDDLCPGEPGYPGPDEGEGDGIMQGAWIAGFSSGRPAQRCPEALVGCEAPECCVSTWAHDDILVQIAVLRQGEVTVAFAALDTVGLFHTDIEQIRESIPPELGVDLLVMAATHNHEGPDTAGQWGPANPVPFATGRDPRFLEKIRTQTVAGIAQALEALEPVQVEVAALKVDITTLGMTDSRNPYIFDDNVPVVRLVSLAPEGGTVATLLSLANHPEVLWASNPYLTSDYPHYVRKYVRDGLPEVLDEDGETVLAPALPGLGGVVVFFAGALGGLVNPGKGTAVDHAGNVYEEHSFRMADAVGQALAKPILQGHAAGGLFAVLEDTTLRFATRRFLSGVKNTVFQAAAFLLRLLERDIYNATEVGLFTFAPGLPMLQSQTAVVQVGPLSFFTGPGEVFPETLTGGFPGKPSAQSPLRGDVQEHRAAAVCGPDLMPVPEGEAPGTHPCLVRPDQAHPPDFDQSPDPPYGYDWVAGEYKFFIGLGMDFVGYMVPEYDYVVLDYFNQAPGDHYEETNGIGPDALPDWRAALLECVEALSAARP